MTERISMDLRRGVCDDCANCYSNPPQDCLECGLDYITLYQGQVGIYMDYDSLQPESYKVSVGYLWPRNWILL